MLDSPGWHFWLVGFALTVIFELPVVWWVLRPGEPNSVRRALLFLIANLATHPLVWFFFPGLPVPRPVSFVLSETFAVGVEAACFAALGHAVGVRRACVASLIANLTSVTLGWLLIRSFGRWLFTP
jgi:hypothetical protein